MSTTSMEKHMQKHKDQGDLDSLTEYPAPILCEDTRVVNAADVLRELFQETANADAARANSAGDDEVEEASDEDEASSEDFQDNNDFFSDDVVGFEKSSNDEDPMENDEAFSEPSLVHLMLQGEASNTSNRLFSEAGRTRTLNYNKSYIGTASPSISTRRR